MRSHGVANAIVLSLCCGALLTTSLACKSQTFGDLRPGERARSLTQDAEDPAISRWLMRLPADKDSAEPTSADAGVSGQMPDADPIGGEVHHFSRRTMLTRAPARDVREVPRRKAVATNMGRPNKPVTQGRSVMRAAPGSRSKVQGRAQSAPAITGPDKQLSGSSTSSPTESPVGTFLGGLP